MNSDIYTNIQKLNNEISKFIFVIRGCSKKQLQQFSCGFWTTKDVLIHIVFWHEHYLSVLQALYNREKPKLLKGTFRENSYIGIKSNKNVSINILIRRLEDAQSVISRIVLSNRISPTKLVKFKEGSKLKTLDEAIEKIAAHIRDHTNNLKEYFNLPEHSNIPVNIES